MQERQVTAGGETHDLQSPFFVLATQNPIEQEGTYPLPEAQLDRFMFNVLISYPELEEELAIVESTTGVAAEPLQRLLSREEVLAYQELVTRVPVARNVTSYAVQLARATRPVGDEGTAVAKEFLAWGAGPRAAQFLVRGAKARALLTGRPTPDIDDVRRLAFPVLRHRLVTNFHAEAESVGKDRIIAQLLEEVAA
jgi:MoxR-like ATPase